MSWYSGIDSPKLRQYLIGLKTLQERQKLYGRKWLFAAIAYLAYWEIKRTLFQQEWEKSSWIPKWVLTSRREHYINNEYVRRREGLTSVFTFSNWDPQSQMVYHMDRNGGHTYEKLVLPRYYNGVLDDYKSVEYLSTLAMYNANKDKRYDLDNYLNHKTVTLGDWISAAYYWLNKRIRSFDPFMIKPDLLYDKEREHLALNFQRDCKPEFIVDMIDYIRFKLRKFNGQEAIINGR